MKELLYSSKAPARAAGQFAADAGDEWRVIDITTSITGLGETTVQFKCGNIFTIGVAVQPCCC